MPDEVFFWRNMQPSVEAPTPQALADLVARCTQIGRFARQLTAVEEARIAALASGILTMRDVLELRLVPSHRLPARQSRIGHWTLTSSNLADLATPAIKELHGTLALDEHEQVKVLSDRTWRGVWRTVTLWRDGAAGLSACDLMQYLAILTEEAQRRTPVVAELLLRRGEAVAATLDLLPARPRSRAD